MIFKSLLSLVLFLCILYSIESSIQSAYAEKQSYGCLCANYSCGCCVHLEVPKVGLNDTGCVNMTYLPDEYGISFTMTIDNLAIFNETISARNPPPICFGAPVLKEYADLCVHFYDLDASKTKLHGCVDIEARLHKIVVARYKVGCFNIGSSSINAKKWRKIHHELIKKISLLKKMSHTKLAAAKSNRL